MNFKKTAPNVLVIINIVVFTLMMIIDQNMSYSTLIDFGAKANFRIADYYLWHLVTPLFLHGSLMHLLFNCYALYLIGNMTVSMLGTKKFLQIYFFSGIISIMGSFILTDSLSVGASGAIFGLLGIHLYYFAVNPSRYKELFGVDFLVIIGLNLVLGFTMGNIDNAGHVFGLIGGFTFMLMFSKVKPLWLPSGKKLISFALVALLLLSFGTRLVSYKGSYDYYLTKILYYVEKEDYEKANEVFNEGSEIYSELFNLISQ